MNLNDIKLGDYVYYCRKEYSAPVLNPRIKTDADGIRWKEVTPPRSHYVYSKIRLIGTVKVVPTILDGYTDLEIDMDDYEGAAELVFYDTESKRHITLYDDDISMMDQLVSEDESAAISYCEKKNVAL